LWILYLSGNITSWDGNSTRVVASLDDIVNRCHYEQGLLGMAFDDDYENTSTVLLSYVENGTCTGPNLSGVILAEAKIENGVLNQSSIVILREIGDQKRNHNGGHLLSIGNNQYLWGLGDGGGSNDPNSNGQNLSSPHGAIHLFQYVNGTMSPVLNNTEGDPYLLHSGLRNPWRFDVDPNGGLWIADVGQSCWEEINLVTISEPANLGWSEREGFHEFIVDSDCEQEMTPKDDNFTDPVAVYSHNSGRGFCSVSGGYWMDWGPPSLQGGYMYGDFCTGTIWLIKQTDDGWLPEEIDTTGTMIVGFGRGLSDELLVFSWAGTIYEISEV
jgi:glucose/arabinose dehydrogenase